MWRLGFKELSKKEQFIEEAGRKELGKLKEIEHPLIPALWAQIIMSS